MSSYTSLCLRVVYILHGFLPLLVFLLDLADPEREHGTHLPVHECLINLFPRYLEHLHFINHFQQSRFPVLFLIPFHHLHRLILFPADLRQLYVVAEQCADLALRGERDQVLDQSGPGVVLVLAECAVELVHLFAQLRLQVDRLLA